MKDFLRETFRPNTEAERQAVSRYHRQRAVVRGIAVLFMLIVLGYMLLSMRITSARFKGTWIAYNDHADGFHPEDVYLEFKDGVFYKNGSEYGRLQTKGGRSMIPVHAPAGKYNRFLSIDGDVLTIEYELPPTAVVYTSSQSTGNDGSVTSPYNGGSMYAAFAQSLQAQQADRRVTDTYVRISTDYDLTEEQRDALY
ncbi:MAG: hypothetical protein E7319_01225 [Clostridiales bacterium]|nr:hypothetical protein [Clostridiales bacterium]